MTDWAEGLKVIDWNKASELGLIQRINSEILHPLGLAMTRTSDNGVSPNLLVTEDDEGFLYSDEVVIKPILSKEEIHKGLDE